MSKKPHQWLNSFSSRKKAICQGFEVLAHARQEKCRALYFMAFIVRK